MAHDNHNLCLECRIPLELVPGGRNKEGKPFNSFMGCPNFKNHGKRNKPVNNQPLPQERTVTMLEFEQLKKQVDSIQKFLMNDRNPGGSQALPDAEEEYDRIMREGNLPL